jgi:hypothetical protein
LAAYLIELLLLGSSPAKGHTTIMETANIVDFVRRDGISDALTVF